MPGPACSESGEKAAGAAAAATAVTAGMGEAAAEEALAAGPTQLWCGKRCSWRHFVTCEDRSFAKTGSGQTMKHVPWKEALENPRFCSCRDSGFIGVDSAGCGKRAFFDSFLDSKWSLYQDRLGTNIGKVVEK
eukprot:COSAG06_NODE_28717_length_569_cov_1.302128_1_plen_132_part_10